jgi:hypothetical protein
MRRPQRYRRDRSFVGSCLPWISREASRPRATAEPRTRSHRERRGIAWGKRSVRRLAGNRFAPAAFPLRCSHKGRSPYHAETSRLTPTSRSDRQRTSRTATRAAAFPKKRPSVLGPPSVRKPAAAKDPIAGAASPKTTPHPARGKTRRQSIGHPSESRTLSLGQEGGHNPQAQGCARLSTLGYERLGKNA